jgi:hypothetical protein
MKSLFVTTLRRRRFATKPYDDPLPRTACPSSIHFSRTLRRHFAPADRCSDRTSGPLAAFITQVIFSPSRHRGPSTKLSVLDCSSSFSSGPDEFFEHCQSYRIGKASIFCAPSREQLVLQRVGVSAINDDSFEIRFETLYFPSSAPWCGAFGSVWTTVSSRFPPIFACPRIACKKEPFFIADPPSRV